MHTIHKFNPDRVPNNAHIIYVDFDLKTGLVQVWAEVFVPYSLDEKSEYKDIIVIGTGMSIPYGYKHVGSCIENGFFVWHVYENKTAVRGEAYAYAT